MIAASERELSIYQLLEEKVFEAAAAAGIAISKDCVARKSVIDDENCQETPQMFFEDVLDELQTAETARRYRLDKEVECARSAAVTTSESIGFLRRIHPIDPFTKLEEVEDKLWNRVRELETKKDHVRTPGRLHGFPPGARNQDDCNNNKAKLFHIAARFPSASVVLSFVLIILLFALMASPLRAALNFLSQQLFDIASFIKDHSPADPEVYRKANEILHQSIGEGDSFSSGTAMIQLHRNATFNANHLEGYKYSKQLLFLPSPVLEAGFRTWANTLEAESLFLLGNPLSGYDQAKEGLLHYNPSQQIGLVRIVGADAKVTSLVYAAVTQWLLGYPDQALRTSTEAVEWAQQINHSSSEAFAQNMRATIYQLRGDSKQSLRDANEAIRLSSHSPGFPFYLAMGTVLQGRALVDEEEAATGIRCIKEGLQLRPPKGRIAQTYFQVLLAEAYGKAGTPEKGIEELKNAQENVEATKESFFEAEINRLHGELLRQAHASDQEAEPYFLKALDIARTQSAKSLELRATLSLARLWQEQGKEEEAMHLLAKIYDRFSEGLETKDLQEAKAFLLLTSKLEGKSQPVDKKPISPHTKQALTQR